jgi:hypothetical protein
MIQSHRSGQCPQRKRHGLLGWDVIEDKRDLGDHAHKQRFEILLVRKANSRRLVMCSGADG